MSREKPATGPSAPQRVSRPAASESPGEPREVWERKWQRLRGEEFGWYLAEPPQELKDLVASGSIPSGASLDLGCGPGIVTAYLAGHFRPSVGLDIALGAVAEARELARGRGANAAFLVAEAPILPFRTGAFSFVFDRGCMQNVSQDVWPAYFREVERLLAPGGIFQLYCSKPARIRSLLSLKALRLRARRLLRGRKAASRRNLSHEFLRRLAPRSMTTVSMRDFPFRLAGGGSRLFVLAQFRKEAGPA